jgi:hypothetical protein
MPDWAVNTVFKATDKMTPAFNQMSNAADKVNKGISAFGLTMGGILPILTFAGIMDFANRSMEAFKKEQAAVANVEAGLRSTKNAAGLTINQLKTMSDTLMKNSIFGDEDILQNATAQLLTFTGITSQNFARVQTVVADVTTKLKGINATGEDLHGVSIMMGKAMENPIRGLTAMRRIGISFSDSEEQMVNDGRK